MDRYRRTDKEVRAVISEIGLERIIAVSHAWFTELGFAEQTEHAYQTALANGAEYYQPKANV